MNYGEQEDTKIILPMYLWTWSHGFLLLYLLGPGFIESKGNPLSICISARWTELCLFFRDIPLPLVTSGCDNSGNLRELALNRMKDFGAVCRDVRYREVGVSYCHLLS